MTLEELQKKIEDYTRRGFIADVAAACKHAKYATTDYIKRTHPKIAFSGKNLITAPDGTSEIIPSHYAVEVDNITATIYANYFARWYNTGAHGGYIRGRGPRQGMKATKYPARGDYFGRNKAAIETYFASQVDAYLETHIKL